MTLVGHPWGRRIAALFAQLKRTEAAQIAEFAVVLPLLMVLVVGIGDFGGVIVLKQKLNNVVREGARLGANEVPSDLYGATSSPASVNAIASLVGQYLQAAKLNDCGLAAGSWGTPRQLGPLSWKYTANSCALTLVVDRGFPIAAGTTGGATKWLICTQVTISYPYQWQFNRVIGLLVSGASYPSSSQLSASAVMPNLS